MRYFSKAPSRIRAFKVLLLSTKKPFKRGHQIADPFRVARRFCSIFSLSKRPPKPTLQSSLWSAPRLALVGSTPGPGRFHAWLVFRALAWKSRAKSDPHLLFCLFAAYPSAPTPRAKSGLKHVSLPVAYCPFGADSPSEIRLQACLFACCLPTLGHRPPERNPASSVPPHCQNRPATTDRN